ncbi:MAG TPA: 3-deoxy-manno-octulosonate cytidylyltransferase [Gemmatimonadales bacterium]|nr:3-deoxy-manno-octulosonate cytidylyltransferase [Gemmatimonadales bacterium]
MPVLVVIPARLGSTRLPRKPLQPLGGVPLIIRVAERVQGHGVADRLVIATDSAEIAAAVEGAGFEAVKSAGEHASGSDRVHEVSARLEFAEYDEILNVQGDAPFVPATALWGALALVRNGFDLGTAAVPLAPEQARDPAKVKVVADAHGRALYFSRAPIPYGAERCWLHLGVYAYRRAALGRFAATAPSSLERAERLEQLRALELGLAIGVERLEESPGPAIDTLEDLRAAEALWTATQEVTR